MSDFKSVALDFVKINREARQRREISDDSIALLADSFQRVGQINPITIQRDGTLVAGETRYLAAKQLGWSHVSAQFVDELDPKALLLVELEENTKRIDLPWQDQASAVSRYHELRKETEPDWSQDDTATALGLGLRTVQEKIAVSRAINEGDERVIAAPKFSTAKNIVSRKNTRAKIDEIELLPKLAQEEKVINADFLEWAPKYSGNTFNLLHCDFPYGINSDQFGQGAAPSLGGYTDTPELYWRLVDCLLATHKSLLGDSAHVVFWFSMTFYAETLARLREVFWVDPMPLVWYKSDNKGTLPWPDKSARRLYETAFLCSLGDRKIISPTGNLQMAPMGEREHMSEKNELMLRSFFKMFVDKNTRLLDPTCGSGSALRAAEYLGAKSVLGLEINPDFAKQANARFK